MQIQAPKGTKDVLPGESYKWQYIEKEMRDLCRLYGINELRTPIIEHTELFMRGVGDTTDIVQKEMYTFKDKGDRSITLRPEGTAGICRAAIENGLLGDALPLKVSYVFNCFRYEKAQRGRFRQFHQFGVECYGAIQPVTDAEVISLAWEGMQTLGLKDLTLAINSIGCPTCRAEYHKALRAYFEARKDQLCDTCLSRLEKNPMRILDCKSPICGELGKDAPVILDYLCEDCKTHFEKLQGYLKAMDIDFSINPKIVRGLDYYTKTVFEFVTTDIGAQGTVCGGGRYDGLIEELGGQHQPALGFAMGIERLLLTMESQGCDFLEPNHCDLYIATMDPEGVSRAMQYANLLRQEGFWVEYDLLGRSFKSQMKYADKIGTSYLLVLGENELTTGNANLKNMKTGEQTPLLLDDSFVDSFTNVAMYGMFDGVMDEISF